MATQITHIALGEKVYNKHFSHLAKRDFFIGTCFPDIRVLNKVDREITHPSTHFHLKDIDQSNAFTAGFQVHNLIDQAREDFVVKQGIYNLSPTDTKHVYIIPKLLEDRLLYDKVSDWSEYIGFFDAILPEELEYGIPEDKIRLWHKTVQRYFEKPPTNETNKAFQTAIGISEQDSDEMAAGVAKIVDNPKVHKIINDLYNHFDEIIERW